MDRIRFGLIPKIPPNDINTFTSLEKIMFMHNLASATTFLTTDNGENVTEQGWCTLKMRLKNTKEQGLYLADITEYLCKHYDIDKTDDKAFRSLFTDVE